MGCGTHVRLGRVITVKGGFTYMLVHFKCTETTVDLLQNSSDLFNRASLGRDTSNLFLQPTCFTSETDAVLVRDGSIVLLEDATVIMVFVSMGFDGVAAGARGGGAASGSVEVEPEFTDTVCGEVQAAEWADGSTAGRCLFNDCVAARLAEDVAYVSLVT
jgi:hypothetical protein